jgi:hypothetical protein
MWLCALAVSFMGGLFEVVTADSAPSESEKAGGRGEGDSGSSTTSASTLVSFPLTSGDLLDPSGLRRSLCYSIVPATLLHLHLYPLHTTYMRLTMQWEIA